MYLIPEAKASLLTMAVTLSRRLKPLISRNLIFYPGRLAHASYPRNCEGTGSTSYSGCVCTNLYPSDPRRAGFEAM